MTFRESEYPDLVRHLLNLIQKEGVSLTELRAQAQLVEKLSAQYPIYPGLILEQLKPEHIVLKPSAPAHISPADKKITHSRKQLAKMLLDTEIPTDRAYTVLVWGTMDTGKSSLVHYLANELIRAGRKVGILDCDMGQSDIGPPSTIGLALTRRTFRTFAELKISGLRFVGSHAAAMHLLPALTGTAQLCAQAKSHCEILLVDTTGWVIGAGARAYRQSEYGIVQPDLVIALERKDELSPLMKSATPNRMVRVTVPPRVKKRSRGRRSQVRQQLYRAYFSRTRRHSFSWQDIRIERAYLLTGNPVWTRSVKTLWAETYAPSEGIFIATNQRLTEKQTAALKNEFSTDKIRTLLCGTEKGLLCALSSGEGEVAAIGTMDHIDFRKKKIVMSVPLSADLTRVRAIQIGSVQLNPDFTEAGFIEPGSL